MVIYVNEKGVVRSIPSSVPQGTVLRSVVIIAPEGAAETLVLKVFPPSQEKIPDIICKPALDVDGNVVCTASIPAAVTKYAGKAEYQIFAYNKEKEVFPSDRGSFTVTRGVLTDMPDSVKELEKYTIDELYSLLTNVNMVYELLEDTQSEFNDLNEIVNTLVTGISQKVDKLKPNDKRPWIYVANHDGTQGYRVLTAATTPDTVMYRDENGRSQVELPSQPKDIANKIYVDGVMEHTRNELEVIAKGATKAIAFLSYSNLVMDLNQADATKYSVGQPFLIGTVDVPDLWVFAVYPEPIPYVYDNDDSIVEELESKNFISIGYYALAPLETQKVDLTEYVKQDSLRSKMDVPPVSTEFTRVPTVETDGSQSYTSLNDEAAAGTIAFRYKDGRLRVGAPVEENDATNKSYVENNFSNALKGTEHGTIVAMDDVSPIPHKIPVKTSSKNLCNVPSITVSGTDSWTSKKVGDFLLPNGNYVLSCDYEQKGNTSRIALSARKYGATEQIAYGGSSDLSGKMSIRFTITDDCNGGITLFAYSNESENSLTTECEFKNIQIEKGTVATEFTPYVADDTEITVKSCGKNLVDIRAIVEYLISERPTGFSIVEFDGKQCVKFLSSVNGFNIFLNGLNAHGFRCSIYTKGYPKSVMGVHYDDGFSAYISSGNINAWKDISLYYNNNNRTISYLSFYSSAEEENAVYIDLDSFFVEASATETEYEPYKEGETITTTIAEGAELNSIAPNMTIATDIDGVTINTEYNKDSNKVIKKLTQAIISLGGNI